MAQLWIVRLLDMITPAKMLFVIILGAIAGAVFFLQSIPRFEVRNAPIVTGHIISRLPIREYSVPRVDFTIRIDGTDTEVHAHTQRYLMTKVPEVVRFHYSGDPSRQVFLFEQEENPYWICLFLWGVSLFLTFCMRSDSVRQMLGWKKVNIRAPA